MASSEERTLHGYQSRTCDASIVGRRANPEGLLVTRSTRYRQTVISRMPWGNISWHKSHDEAKPFATHEQVAASARVRAHMLC